MLSHVLHRRRQIGDNPGLLVQGTIVTPWIVWVDVVNPIFQMTFSDSADYISLSTYLDLHSDVAPHKPRNAHLQHEGFLCQWTTFLPSEAVHERKVRGDRPSCQCAIPR